MPILLVITAHPNIIFSNLNNLSGSVIFGSNFNNDNSNSFSNYSTSNIVFQNLNNFSNSTLLANNTGYWCSNNFSNIATSTALTTYSNYVSVDYASSNITFCNLNSLNSGVLFSSNIGVWSSNLNFINSNSIISLSNNVLPVCTFGSNTSYFASNLATINSNNINTQSNYNKTTYNYCSNLEFFTSNLSVFSSNLCIFNSNNNSNYTTSNILFPLINSNTTRSVFSSNYLSNCRILSTLVPWTQVSGKPDFSSDGAGNDAIGVSGVTIESAGLLMSGYALLDKNGKLTYALTDSLGNMTIDPSGCFKLNDPRSYIDIGNSTTRLSKDRLLFKTGTFSNMIMNPENLSYSNAIFSLCNQIALTATSISNLTHVSCSSNLTVMGSAGVGSLTCIGLSLTSGLTTLGNVISTTYAPNLSAGQYILNNFGVAQTTLNAAFTGFAYTSHGSSNNYAGFGLWGYNLGSSSFNACGNGKFGVCTTSPTATLDVNGTANISTTLTSATHSNSGNMQIGGTLSLNGTPSGMTRKYWNNARLGNWNISGNNYFLLATSPNSGAGNNAGSLRLSGTIGGFFAGNLAMIDATITCRGGVQFLGSGYGAIQQAQLWSDVIVYNSNNVQYQYLLSITNSFSGFDLEVSCGDVGNGTVLMEPSSTPFYSNLVFNTSNSSLGSVLSNLQIKIETGTSLTTISSNTFINGYLQATNVLCTSATISNLTVPAGVITIFGGSSYLDIIGTGSQAKIFAHSDNQSYMQHSNNLVFSTRNQITPQIVMSNNGSMSIASNPSIGSNLTVSRILTVGGLQTNNAPIRINQNALYIDDGNKGIIYSGALSTYNSNFISTDGPVIYGWQGGALGTLANGGNFAIHQSNLTGSLYWNNTGVGVFKSNPAHTLDVVGNINASSNIYASSCIGVGTTSPGYPLEVVGTTVSSTFAGNLAFPYLTSVPALCSNTSPQVLYGSNTGNWSSNALATVATLANYSWASNAIQSNLNAASVASSVYIASNLIMGSNTTQCTMINTGSDEHNSNMVGYYSFGVVSGAISDFCGMKVYVSSNSTDNQPNGKSNQSHLTWFNWGNSISLSRENMRLRADGTLIHWNGGINANGVISTNNNNINVGTGCLNVATISNSGVTSITSADGDKLVLTAVGSNASKITHASGWNVGFYAGYNTGTSRVHNFYTAYNGGWSNNLQIGSQTVNINGTLSNTGNHAVGGLLKCTNLSTNNNICMQNTYGSIGMIHYSDGSTYYQLATNTADSAGSFNGLRPYQVSLANGDVNMANSQITISHSSGLLTGKAISSTSLTNSGNVVIGGILAVNQNVDTGYGKGIRYWDAADNNWSGYMCQSGVGKSVASNTACVSLDARTAHHIRMRVGSGNGQGFIWENNGENCLMSLTADTGNLFVRNLIQSSNITVGQVLNSTTLSNSGNLSIDGNLAVVGTVQTGLQFPSSDPGCFAFTRYGTAATTLDWYATGQFANGTVRSIISGSYASASFRVCIPTNSNLASFGDLFSVDVNGSCTGCNSISLNNITCTSTLNASTLINCSRLNNTGGDIVLTSGTSSNAVFYSDGSCYHKGGLSTGTAVITSNIFGGDSTFAHVSQAELGGFALTANSSGMTTINSALGQPVNIKNNNLQMAKFSKNDYTIGFDVANLPSGASLGAGPCMVSRPGGYQTMTLVAGKYEMYLFSTDLWNTSKNFCGELTVYFKNTSTTIPGVCMVRYFVSQTWGNTLDFVQLDFRNNNLSLNTAYVYSNGLTFVLNANAAQCYGCWAWKGIL
jgi:hypothetical protein